MDPSLAALLLRWHWRPAVVLVLVALGAAYVGGWARLRRQGGPALATPWRLAAYLGGLAAVAIALLSPLESLADYLFTAHMLQHQLLLMGAPPLLLLGNPFPVVLLGLPRAWRRGLGPLLARTGRARRPWRVLTWMPVAGSLYAANLWAWHWPAAYDLALRHPAVHDLEHLAFFGSAILFWWPVVNPAPRLHRLTSGLQYGCRIGYLVLATAQNTLLGAVLGLAGHVLYPFYADAPRLAFLPWSPLDDQAFGGGVMWSGSHMFLIGILVLVGRALDSEGRARRARVAWSGERP